MTRVREGSDWPSGSIQRFAHRSVVLADNPWGDRCDRELCVYLPPDYGESGAPLASLWDFAAFTNSGPGHLNWRHHGENLHQRLDRLIGAGLMPPVVVAMPDCYTSLGGNQYLNSPSVGRYADYILLELLPLLEQRVNVASEASRRGAFGKSSGGYGALTQAMRSPGVWGAVACHAGDVGFETVYRRDFPVACGVLDRVDWDIEGFLRGFWASPRPTRADYTTLMVLAMAASYDPDPDAPRRIRLPFTPRTCELIPERWANWMAHDPLVLVEGHGAALTGLRALYLDAGTRDEYHIQYGTRALSARLERLGIDHHFEEFEGGHTGTDWRLDISLPFIARALESGPDS